MIFISQYIVLKKVLHFKVVKFSVEIFKLQDFSYEEISVTMGHLSVSNVNHVVINVEVQLNKT